MVSDGKWDSSDQRWKTLACRGDITCIGRQWQLMLQQQWVSFKQNPLDLLVDVTSRHQRQSSTRHQSCTGITPVIISLAQTVSVTLMPHFYKCYDSNVANTLFSVLTWLVGHQEHRSAQNTSHIMNHMFQIFTGKVTSSCHPITSAPSHGESRLYL